MLKIIVALSAALMLAGCKSSDSHDMHDMHHARDMSSDTITCDRCNATWQQKSVVNDKGVRVPQVSANKSDVCATCQKAAEGYFATGTMERCKTCGGKMRVEQATR